jgi:hypothetical protein
MKRCLVGLFAVALAAACSENSPVAPIDDQAGAPPVREVILAALECRVDVGAGTLSCEPASSVAADARFDVIVGNQHRFVRLTNSAPSTVGSTLSAGVTVQNLTLQPMATTDGTTPTADGVRVFFHTGPTNGVNVGNEDGTGTFTGANQPFFQYTTQLGGDGILSQGETSSAKTWEFDISGCTTGPPCTFSFTVFVTAAVPNESELVVSLTEIATGAAHSCGIGSNGHTYCWGQNDQGQVGDGTMTSPRNTPRKVVGGHTFTKLALGSSHTCGIRSDGAAYCWGSDASGQLGNGATTGSQSSPNAVSTILTFTDIAAGASHSCGIDSSGAAHCWGSDASGELGNGATTGTQTSPSAVTGSLIFSQITTGSSYTCAVTTTGAGHCWGSDSDGQLGNGATTGNQTSPSAVSGSLTFTMIEAGNIHTCGIESGGAGHCWGSDADGRLGNGAGGSADAPSAVSGSLTFTDIDAGFSHSCGIAGGAPHCWGDDAFEQLGNGVGGGDQTSPQAVAGGLSLAQLSIGPAGTIHTCGREAGGVAYCWGDNSVAQVGDGTTTTRPSPAFVAATTN